jgi:hypothetical protein
VRIRALAKIFLLFVVAAPLWGCYYFSEFGRLENRLRNMTDQDAARTFKSLTPRRQVGLYVWELEHSHPIYSHYGELVRENGKKLAPLLIHEATITNDGLVNAAILEDIGSFERADLSDLNLDDFAAALDRCVELAGSRRDPICRDVRKELAEALKNGRTAEKKLRYGITRAEKGAVPY